MPDVGGIIVNPPKWYSGNEIYEWFNRRGPFAISKSNAKWMAEEFQKAFEKGWEKALQQGVEPDGEKDAAG